MSKEHACFNVGRETLTKQLNFDSHELDYKILSTLFLCIKINYILLLTGKLIFSPNNNFLLYSSQNKILPVAILISSWTIVGL